MAKQAPVFLAGHLAQFVELLGNPIAKEPARVKSFFCFFLIVASMPAHAGLHAASLKCEYLVNPLGIDASSPRLSWMLESDERAQKQSAYQILVSNNENLRS